MLNEDCDRRALRRFGLGLLVLGAFAFLKSVLWPQLVELPVVVALVSVLLAFAGLALATYNMKSRKTR